MSRHQGFLWNMGLGVLVIGLGGCGAVYCARAYGVDPWHFASRQMIWLGLGVFLFLLTSQVPFRFLKKIAVPAVAVSTAVLILTLCIGPQVKGMRGWLPIPFIGLRFQPSELSKVWYLLLLILLLQKLEWGEWKRFFSGLILTFLFCFLILLQPDFGTATIYAMTFPVVLFFCGFRKRYTFSVLFGWLPFAVLFVILHPYARRRITSFLNPESDLYGAGWHIFQFRNTMANGGLTGSNESGALWAHAYLPFSHSDSVFAALVEAAGFAGGFLVLLGFCVMLALFRKAAMDTKEPAAKYFLFAAGCMLMIQTSLHVGVNATLIPPTGLPMPFFSYGGSNLAGVMLLLGAACSAYRSQESKPEIDAETVQKDQ